MPLYQKIEDENVNIKCQKDISHAHKQIRYSIRLANEQL